MAEPTASPTPDAADDGRRFRRGLVGLAALGAVSQALIQSQAFSGNPMVLVPQVDAAVLWERAGEIAAGELVGDAPYDTAPLMLWVAAGVRALGGGLAALGALQSVLHVVTALVIAVIGRDLVRGERPLLDAGAGVAPTTVGLLAGALFLLLDEPAAATSRVLAGTLQLFLGALLLRALTLVDRRPTISHAARAGLLSGLAALAYPPLVALVPVVGAWLFARHRSALRTSALFVATSAAAILPATVHNLLACGEVIPISSQAGLTFYHGNNELADGTFAAAGVVNSKESQAADSLEKAREALGDPEAGWADASGYWFGRGLDWWAEEPVSALRVSAVKLWYAVSGRRYGDVYQPWMERRDGAASRLWLAPIPVAWIVPAAFVALFLLVRRVGPGAGTPWVLLALVPFAVCVAFWYTPRYRLPAVVALVPLATAGLARASGGGRDAVTFGIALVVGVGAGPLNSAVGFDRHELHERRHAARMAAAYGALERHEDGLRYLTRDMELAPKDPEAASRVVQLLLFLGRDARAAEVIASAPPEVGGLRGPRTLLAWIRATSADPAARDAAAAVEVAEGLVAEFGPEPDLLDTRAAARARAGDLDAAVADARAALAALTDDDPLRTDVARRLARYETGDPYTEPPRPLP